MLKKMLTLEQIVEKLKDRKLVAIAESTGLSRQTISKVLNGKIKSVSYSVVKTLSDYFMSEGK